MNFSKTYTVESKHYPGAMITLKRIGPQKRAEIEIALAGPRSRQRELAAEEKSLEPELQRILEGCEKGEDGKVIENLLPQPAITLGLRLLAIKLENDTLVRSKIEPAYVRAGLKEISEITYEDQPATADLLCDLGPDDLFNEVVTAISRNLRLSSEDAENLKSPSTSAAAVDGPTASTTATPASNEPDSHLSATA